MRKLIHQLKYRGVTELQQVVREVLHTYHQHEDFYFKPAIIVPIPLHWKAKNARGFNQAELVARVLAEELHYPILPHTIQRLRATPSQTRLNRHERQVNMRGVFTKASDADIRGASFIVVDDVWTTGSTLKEAAKVLKRQGAKHVWGFTLAREA
jgi:ComF family protein